MFGERCLKRKGCDWKGYVWRKVGLKGVLVERMKRRGGVEGIEVMMWEYEGFGEEEGEVGGGLEGGRRDWVYGGWGEDGVEGVGDGEGGGGEV